MVTEQVSTSWRQRQTSSLPLVVLRICFGVLMLVSTTRFVTNGWVDEFYIQPDFHFTYYGFGWVKPLPGLWMYAVFGTIALCAIAIAIGYRYRISIIVFFLLFTYTELLDKTYYLNHYYFVSVLSFLLIFLPLNRWASIDVRQRPSLKTMMVPLWAVAAVRLQVGLVYFFAGIAKLNADWLLEAMPLKIWLAARTGTPLIGWLFDYTWTAYAMSWGGMIYDLSIPFLLLYRRTRPWAFLAVIGFHLLTGLLFPIGMFPAIMIACTLVFFTGEELGRFWQTLRWWTLRRRTEWRKQKAVEPSFAVSFSTSPIVATVLICFFCIQLAVPLRHLLYSGNVLWTEEGYRFAWHVMLAEKTGHVTFTVTEPASGKEVTVFPRQFLTVQQEKQMSFQPDMILSFAHHLKDILHGKGMDNVAITAEAYVSLNGRPSQLLLDPTVDLTAQTNNILAKDWVLPLENETVNQISMKRPTLP